MRYLLDTDICIYAMNGHPAVCMQLRSRRRTEVAISVLVEAELRDGAANSRQRGRNFRRLEAFLAPLDILELTSAEALAYGDLRVELERAGTPIGPMDALIAAHALAQDLTLVTNNERALGRVPGLRVENWTKDVRL